jgi:hypothetical protein
VLPLELEPAELLVEEGNFEELLRVFDVVEEMEVVVELRELLEAETTELLDELLRLLVELVESGKLVDFVLVLLEDCELLAETTELLDELLRLLEVVELVELVERDKLVDCVLVLLEDCELVEDKVTELLAEDPVEAAAD